MFEANRDLDICVVCEEQEAEMVPEKFDGIHQICPRCGDFKILSNAVPVLKQNLEQQKRLKLSRWVLAKNRWGEVPLITTAKLHKILFHPMAELENNWVANYGRWEEKRYWPIFRFMQRSGYKILTLILPSTWGKNLREGDWVTTILGVIIWVVIGVTLRELLR